MTQIEISSILVFHKLEILILNETIKLPPPHIRD